LALELLRTEHAMRAMAWGMARTHPPRCIARHTGRIAPLISQDRYRSTPWEDIV